MPAAFSTQDIFLKLNVAEAQATVESDRLKILNDIKTTVGIEAMNQSIRRALVGVGGIWGQGGGWGSEGASQLREKVGKRRDFWQHKATKEAMKRLIRRAPGMDWWKREAAWEVEVEARCEGRNSRIFGWGRAPYHQDHRGDRGRIGRW